MRFFTAIQELSDAEVRYLTEVDGSDHVALVATSIPDPQAGQGERGYGVARFIRDRRDPSRAELAVTVTDDARGLGLGPRLIEALAPLTCARGVNTFTGLVLIDNLRAIRMLLHLGAVFAGREGEASWYHLPVGSLRARSHAVDGSLPGPAAARSTRVRSERFSTCPADQEGAPSNLQ